MKWAICEVCCELKAPLVEAKEHRLLILRCGATFCRAWKACETPGESRKVKRMRYHKVVRSNATLASVASLDSFQEVPAGSGAASEGAQHMFSF